MIRLKTPSEIDGIRVAGRYSADLLNAVSRAAMPGMTTAELDQVARDTIADMGPKASSAFLGYGGFPGCICISVNEELIHGIPGARVLQHGDVVKFDVGVKYDGFIGDNAKTIIVGGPQRASSEINHLLAVTRASLEEAVLAIEPGKHLSDISSLVGKVITKGGCAIVKEYVGHGVGIKLHEDPPVPNYGNPGKGPILRPGMTFCIEPMVNLGSAAVKTLADGWTVVSRDGKPTAHFEYAVALLEDGVEILTPWFEQDPWKKDA